MRRQEPSTLKGTAEAEMAAKIITSSTASLKRVRSPVPGNTIRATATSKSACNRCFLKTSRHECSPRKRGSISRQIDNVFVGEFCDDALHQRGVRAGVGTGLEIVELTHKIDRMHVRQSRHIA